jgi:hypothetical protein
MSDAAIRGKDIVGAIAMLIVAVSMGIFTTLNAIKVYNFKAPERQDECALMAQRATLNGSVSSLLLQEVCSSLTDWELRGINTLGDFKQATEAVALRRLDRHRRR